MVDTVPANTSTTANLGIGSSLSGRIDSNGDHDWYRVTLTAGITYRFAISGTGSGDIVDSTLTLRNSGGGQIKFNDDADGYFSVINYTPTVSGTYYLDVGAFDDAEIGNFVIAASLRPPLTVYNNDQIAFQLTTGSQGSNTPTHFAVSSGGQLTVNITGLTAAGQTLARVALDLWADATGLRFVETGGVAQISFDDSDDGAYTTTTFSGSTILSAGVNISTQWLADYGTTVNSYSMQTYIHEIGHALGIGHAGDYNDNASFPDDALYLNDSWATSVMSYFSQTDNSYFAGLGFSEAYVLTPMVADIIAMQQMYGTASGTRTGNTVYGFGSNAGRAAYDASANPGAAYTIVDHGGVDTADYSLHNQNQLIDLLPEAFSNIGGRIGNVSIARGTIIENAVSGSGNDTLLGNAASNELWGNGGNDILDGRGGSDIMRGGAGDDLFLIDDSGDRVIEQAGAGYDIAYSSANFILEAGSQLEVLSSNSHIGTAALNLTGNEFSQVIYGNAGNNVLNGGGGIDYLVGFGGDDIYLIDNLGDQVYENIGGGFDTIQTFLTYALPANLEIEILALNIGTAIDGLDLYGNEFAQALYGSPGVNRLYSGGGGDVMQGLGGNDIYYVLATADRVVEQTGAGRDVVYALVNFTLEAGSEVDVLSTSSAAGTTALSLTGNEFTQEIYGNDGVNQLNGGGGDDWLFGFGGNDAISGGGGNDFIYGGAGSDTVTFAGARSSYQISISNGVVTVVDLDGAADGNDGIDTIVEIETLLFKNGETVSVSSLGSAPAALSGVDAKLGIMRQDMAAFGGSASVEGSGYRRQPESPSLGVYALT